MRSLAFLFFVFLFSNLYSQPYHVFDSTKQSALENLINNQSETENYYRFNLSQNYPNPFNPSTSISYELRETSQVTIIIYDALGKEVKRLVNEIKEEGNHKITFDASGLPSGVYIYQMKMGKEIISKKMLLIK